MWESLTQFVKSRDLRRKAIFVLALLAIFRLGATVPVPGVNAAQLQNLFSGETGQILGLLNLFSGSALANLSVMMLGVGPYITASIIMQLLTMIFPRLKEMYQEEGEAGRQRFNQYSRLLTVPLALLQGYGLLTLLARQGLLSELSFFGLVADMLIITAGSILLMWLGELITEKGLGNGVSLIIFAGIVASFPTDFMRFSATFQASQAPSVIAFLAIAIIVIAGVVLVNEGERAVPVSYAKRIRGFRMYGGISTHLPLRVNQAGVIPIIFALSILLFPSMIGAFLSRVPQLTALARFLTGLTQNQLVYGVLYFVLVVLFTYFYTAVTFDPQAISSNLQKQGGFIPGIRPGSTTAEYLYRVLTRITLGGAIFLGLIAVLPLVIQGFLRITTLTIGGTALLIVVSVVLETAKQVKAQLVMREYEGF
ncbi:preprotein translocase subunit SecY [Candidatus Parcubacteria bacterium]|nr:preprotein translocase subunit SecY [Candidatus Parcubacteria bacterium]MBI4098964.1 preprotein translocase subunit SecY [Candidatus Parcubacteria bacterium]